ncbi:MAG TPA: methylated-DNA--[protein]-cysteine S-methyltransferase [Caulobacteraceae bacterium]|jgi:methylated-DNA-[protein]-cysteine S-methyltransferase
MTNSGYSLFDTAIGVCGVGWRERGLVGVLLPEVGGAPARARLHGRFPDLIETTPPPEIQAVIDSIVALMNGEAINLSDAPLDLDIVSPFERRVYAIARAIPPGRTMTYGEIAVQLGDKLLAQQVGQAMGNNPWPIVVPCHRVLGAGGKMVGFSAPGGVSTKERMLAIEGYFPGGQPSLFG